MDKDLVGALVVQWSTRGLAASKIKIASTRMNADKRGFLMDKDLVGATVASLVDDVVLTTNY